MSFENYLQHKSAFVFELDNVIYPEKDYLLQVYYLFAQFMEYGEQMDAQAIIKSMQNIYFGDGPEHVFDKTIRQLHIPDKYKLNFDLLMLSARLPLKLLIFNEVLRLMQEIVMERKQIFIFTNGDPAVQLNKIRQIEWHGLENYLKVYFSAESVPKPSAKGIKMIIDQYDLKKSDVLMVGHAEVDKVCAKKCRSGFFIG